MSLRVFWFKLFNVQCSNAFQWNCFNWVYTCNIALILFLKCDVTTFRIPLPLSHNVTLRRPPPLSLMCDIIYGFPLVSVTDNLYRHFKTSDGHLRFQQAYRGILENFKYVWNSNVVMSVFKVSFQLNKTLLKFLVITVI